MLQNTWVGGTNSGRASFKEIRATLIVKGSGYQKAKSFIHPTKMKTVTLILAETTPGVCLIYKFLKDSKHLQMFGASTNKISKNTGVQWTSIEGFQSTQTNSGSKRNSCYSASSKKTSKKYLLTTSVMKTQK